MIDRAAMIEAITIMEEIDRRKQRRKLFDMYPETGPYRRALYPKHMECFAAGAAHRERAVIAANRVGKTWGVGAYETTLHLTGLYPDWWEGARFDHPVSAWAAGKTNVTTRDIVQDKLFGPVATVGGKKTLSGTGMIPGDTIGKISWKQGVPDLVDYALVQHVSGGWSDIGLRSYEQGRGVFEGTEKHWIWFDEEPPLDCYTESITRTMTVGGLILVTFTPLEGMSEVVLSFLNDGAMPDEPDHE